MISCDVVEGDGVVVVAVHEDDVGVAAKKLQAWRM